MPVATKRQRARQRPSDGEGCFGPTCAASSRVGVSTLISPDQLRTTLGGHTRSPRGGGALGVRSIGADIRADFHATSLTGSSTDG